MRLVSYLVEAVNDHLFFNNGGGVVDNLLRSGQLPKDIKYVINTHYHNDHMMYYARLVHAAWDEGATPSKVFEPNTLKQIAGGCFGPKGICEY